MLRCVKLKGCRYSALPAGVSPISRNWLAIHSRALRPPGDPVRDGLPSATRRAASHRPSIDPDRRSAVRFRRQSPVVARRSRAMRARSRPGRYTIAAATTVRAMARRFARLVTGTDYFRIVPVNPSGEHLKGWISVGRRILIRRARERLLEELRVRYIDIDDETLAGGIEVKSLDGGEGCGVQQSLWSVDRVARRIDSTRRPNSSPVSMTRVSPSQ